MNTLMDKKEFGEFIRFMRQAIGFTRKEFADLINDNWSNIRNYEKGICLPRHWETMERLVRESVKNELKRRRGLM